MVIYQLVSRSQKGEVESSFCLRGERLARFVLEEAALKTAKRLREDPTVTTVYGAYAQSDGSWLIGLASARPGGKYRQTFSLRELSGKFDPSLDIWKSATIGRLTQQLGSFVTTCLDRL